jgi:transcriptional regulator with XRE-family HTH domain
MPNLLKLAQARRLAKNGTGRMIRVSHGLSLKDIGNAIYASPTTVLRWERFQRVPHGEAAERWAELIEKLSRGGL